MAEIGILKSLGLHRLLDVPLPVVQSLALCCVGGGIGLLLAWATEKTLSDALGKNFPGYLIRPGTFVLAGVITVSIGLVAGVAPAVRAARLRCVEALREVD